MTGDGKSEKTHLLRQKWWKTVRLQKSQWMHHVACKWGASVCAHVCLIWCGLHRVVMIYTLFGRRPMVQPNQTFPSKELIYLLLHSRRVNVWPQDDRQRGWAELHWHKTGSALSFSSMIISGPSLQFSDPDWSKTAVNSLTRSKSPEQA
jgi:hypothetical protein